MRPQVTAAASDNRRIASGDVLVPAVPPVAIDKGLLFLVRRNRRQLPGLPEEREIASRALRRSTPHSARGRKEVHNRVAEREVIKKILTHLRLLLASEALRDGTTVVYDVSDEPVLKDPGCPQ